MSGGGRRGTNWEEARDFWIALGPRRSFGTVARRVGVSDTRVRFVARRDDWQRHADEVDAQALDETKRRIVRKRADRVSKTLGIIDGALDVFDVELEAKAREARLRDMSEMVKLAELLEGEATDRISFGELQEALGVLAALGVRAIEEGWPVKRWLDEVRRALGAIDGEANAA